MRKTSINLWVLVLLFVVAIFNVTSCDNTDGEQEINLNEYGLNTSENRQSILDLIQDESQLRSLYEENQRQIRELLRPAGRSSSADEDPITSDELLAYYQSCTTCATEHNDFLIPLFEELVDASNENVMAIIETHENSIASMNLSDQTKSDLYFLTFAFKASAEAYLETIEEASQKAGFWDCFGSKVGRNVGEGMVTGFVTGCVIAGKAAAAAGTVALPIVGTVTGAVAGCVAGGGMAAVTGAIAGVAWSALKCIF